MHELSLATSLLEMVRKHTPPAHTPTKIHITAGPLQDLDPAALDMAWQSLTANTPFASCALLITQLPWTLTCPACKHAFTSPDPYIPCPACSSPTPIPTGTADLLLTSLDVDPIPTPVSSP